MVLALFTGLAAIGLVGPDEPRYAWIARDMAQSGDWVTPRLYGQPWFEKPILYYWMASVGFRLTASAEWAARVPSALAALCAALSIAWLALKHYGEKTAWAALIIFSTTIGTLAFARAATPDMLFSASLALAMASAAEMLGRARLLRTNLPASQPARLSRGASIFFGAALGLATLAKGPGALVLAGGSIGLWAICTRQWRSVVQFLSPTAISSFSIIAFPWYVLCAWRNPDFLHTFLLLHNFQRYLTPVFQHRQPIWFFGPIVLIALLPWSILLVPAVAEGVRRVRAKNWVESPALFVACWAIFPVLFFSFSQSKLPGYILPAVAPLALLGGVALEREISASRSGRPWILVAVAATVLGLYLFAPVVANKYLPDLMNSQNWHERGKIVQWYGVILFLAFSVFLIVRAPRLALSSICASGLFLSLMVNDTLRIAETRSDDQFSARRIAASPQLRPPYNNDPVALYRAHRNWEYGLNFYFGRVIPEWTPQMRGPAIVFTSPSALNALKGQASVASVQIFGIPKCVKAAIEGPLLLTRGADADRKGAKEE